MSRSDLKCPLCKKSMYFSFGEWANGAQCLIWQCYCGHWEVRL